MNPGWRLNPDDIPSLLKDASAEMVMVGLWIMRSKQEKRLYLTMYELLKTLAKAQVTSAYCYSYYSDYYSLARIICTGSTVGLAFCKRECFAVCNGHGGRPLPWRIISPT